MPAITIKVFERELTWGQTAELIEDVTNAVVPFVGEAVRSNVWVRIEKVTPKRIVPVARARTSANRKLRARSAGPWEERNVGRRP